MSRFCRHGQLLVPQSPCRVAELSTPGRLSTGIRRSECRPVIPWTMSPTRFGGEGMRMNDTWVTVVGNAATAAALKTTPTGVPVVRFRLAATSRRFDREGGQWVDGETSFYSVRAWRSLARNVASSLAIGDPLIVQGRLRVRDEQRDGQRWVTAEIDAVSAGHDLGWGTSAFRRVSQANAELTAAHAPL